MYKKVAYYKNVIINSDVYKKSIAQRQAHLLQSNEMLHSQRKRTTEECLFWQEFVE